MFTLNKKHIILYKNSNDRVVEMMLRYESIDAYSQNDKIFTFVVNGVSMNWAAESADEARKIASEIKRKLK